MDVRLATFASELTKISEDSKKKKQSYGQQLASAVPFAVATSVADVPKGWVDKYVDQTLRKTPKAKRTSGVGRGVGRGLGRLAPSIVTAPVFLSGIKDLKSDDKDTQRRGYAKVLGSGLAYGAIKGGVETGTEEALSKGLKGVNWSKLLGKVRRTAGARGIVTTGAGALTAAAVAKGQKKSEKSKGKESLTKQYGMPAAVGALSGAAKGGFEEAWELGRKASKRGMLARAGGRAAAGAMGAAVLSGAVGKLTGKKSKSTKKSKPIRKFKPGKVLKPSKKDPTVRRWQNIKTASEPQTFGPTGGALYDQVRDWSKDKNEADIYNFYKQIVAEGQGERTPSRRAAHYALVDEMKDRGEKLPEPVMRKKVTGKVPAPTHGDAAALLAVALSPAIATAATANLPQTDRDRVLADALDRQFIQGRLRRITIQDDEIPAFSPSERRVYLRAGESPGIVAHELGHEQAGKLRRALLSPKDPSTAHAMRKIHDIGRGASLILPMLAVGTVTDQSFATPEELESRANLVRNIGVVAGLAQAPTLVEETLANQKAVQLLQRVGASKKEALLKVLKQAGPGYATYAVPALFPFVVSKMLRHKASKGERQ